MLAHPRVTPTLKLLGEFPSIHLDSQRNCQSKVLYTGSDIIIHRLARQWRNVLHFRAFASRSFSRFACAFLYRAGPANPPVLQASIFSRPSLTPIDSTFCYAYRLVGTLGGPRFVTADPRGKSNSLFLYIGLYTVTGGSTTLPSEEGLLPPLYRPGMVTVAPGGVPATFLYTGVCTTLVYHPGGRFSLVNKVQECMGLTFALYWSFSSPTFSHTILWLLLFLNRAFSEIL